MANDWSSHSYNFHSRNYAHTVEVLLKDSFVALQLAIKLGSRPDTLPIFSNTNNQLSQAVFQWDYRLDFGMHVDWLLLLRAIEAN